MQSGVDVASVSLVAASVFAWGVLSGRLERADLTAPIVFVAVGVFFTHAVPILDFARDKESAKLVAEVTLVWILFSDAARVGVADLRRDIGMYVRLLGVALPLTMVAGTGLAVWLLDGTDVWLALLVGAALAPTDAALGAPVMTNPAVPARVRSLLNVESGLNDGIATPVVTVAIAGAATAEAVGGSPTAGQAVLELLVGLGIGVGLGLAGGWVLRWSRQRHWLTEEFTGPAVLALALLAFTLSLQVDGNGFVAAFVGGVAFGHAAGRGTPSDVRFAEQTGAMSSQIVWLVFGALAVPIAWAQLSLPVVLYAVLSLTLVRMVPVAVSVLGSGLGWPTAAFLGWFGPRGLASVIFAVLALEELGAAADQAAGVISMTVLLSVFAHGLSADPLSRRYGDRIRSSNGTGKVREGPGLAS